jgi:predicted transcriptional regulator
MVNKIVHPQEITVWYLLPSIRREIAMNMKSRGVEQKKIALMLGVTEPAVSQYSNHKRASEIKFSAKIKEEIKNSVNNITAKKSTALAEIQRIITLPEMKEMLCMIHKKSKGISKDCAICAGI